MNRLTSITDTPDHRDLSRDYTHEFTQHHLELDIEVKLDSVSGKAHADIADAYHALIDLIKLHANDYDTAQCSIASTLKQNFEIIGAF